MSHIIHWIGTHVVAYYVTGFTVLCALLFLAVYEGPAQKRILRDPYFVLVTALMLLAWRWPAFVWPTALNPDESSFAASAIKATGDFVPWRGFDVGTSGPLNSYILMLPLLIHAPINFASIRIVAALLILTAIIASYYAIKWTHGRRVARIAVVPPLLFLSFTVDWDFVHYSSEHLPICLTTIGLACAAYLAKGSSFQRGIVAAAIAGLCVGAACFAKLQAIPIAAAIFCFTMAALFRWARGRPRREWIVAAATIVGGVLLVPALISLVVLWGGAWSDAFFSYIRMNLNYMAGSAAGVGVNFFLTRSRPYTLFLVGTLALLVVAGIVLVWRRSFRGESVWLFLLSALFFLLSIVVIHQPHRLFPHYLLFSAVPLTCCLASSLRITHDAGWWAGRETALSIVFVLLFLIPALSISADTPNIFLSKLAANARPPKEPVVKAIARYAKPGECICVWGWASEYYVQTGTLTASRENSTLQEIEPSPYREFFRSRYMADIQKSKPVVFVDSVAPVAYFYRDRAQYGFEIFPALATYVEQNYVLKEVVDGVRIYVAKK